MKISSISCALVAACLIAFITPSCKKGSSNPAPIVDKTPDSLKVGLLAYYPFDNNANDISGNGNNGSAFLVTPTTDRHGNANGAYSFDGYNNYVSVPGKPSLSLNNTNFTLSVWVKLYTYSSAGYIGIVTRRFAGSTNGWILGLTGPTRPPAGLTFFEITGIAAAAGNNIVDFYGWHMITVVYNLGAQQMSVYLDGKLDHVTDNIPSPNPPPSSNVYIGRDDPSTQSAAAFFNGAMEEVRIYNRALSASAIQKLYTF